MSAPTASSQGRGKFEDKGKSVRCYQPNTSRGPPLNLPLGEETGPKAGDLPRVTLQRSSSTGLHPDPSSQTQNGRPTPLPTFPTDSWMARILLPSPRVAGRALGAPGAEDVHCSSPERLSAEHGEAGTGSKGQWAWLPRVPPSPPLPG